MKIEFKDMYPQHFLYCFSFVSRNIICYNANVLNATISYNNPSEIENSTLKCMYCQIT